MANLFPVGYDEVSPYPGSNQQTEKPIGYKPGILFDYEETGDFVRDGRRKVVEATGIGSWKSWVVNCLQTQRYAHLAYSTDFGIEIDKIFAAATHVEAESILKRQITDAIMADDYKRASSIEFNYIDWTVQPDSVYVDFTIYGITDVTIDIQTYITRGQG